MLAFVGVFVYPVGIPVLTLLALLRVTKSILAEDAKTLEVYEFLIADYKPQFFYWDCFEMLRKVCITGLLIFVSRGSFFQLVVTTLLCIGFGFTAAWFQPYSSRAANMFKVGTEATLLITLSIAGFIRVDLTDGTLPAFLSLPDTGELDVDGVGVLLVFANTILPGVSLALGVLSFGLDAQSVKEEIEHFSQERAEREGEFDNPIADDAEVEDNHELNKE